MSSYRFAPPEPALEVAGIPLRTLALFIAGVLGGMLASRLAGGALSFLLFFGVAITLLGCPLPEM